MAGENYGVCEKCLARVPADFVIREGKVLLRKNCHECGQTESLVSSSAEVWQRKRQVWQYDEASQRACRLNCHTCHYRHPLRIVFVDVTNRCNMNCPICVANIPGMGFEFNPPLAYFEKVFKAISELPTDPAVMLFGGEPTVREDLFEIIELARSYHLKVRLVTNGLKLADEDYCRRICEAKVPVLIAFDGLDPEIYTRMRKSPEACRQKLKALENLKRLSRSKTVIMCCVARHINDKHLPDLLDYVHENRDFVAGLYLLPLIETWEEGEFQTDVSTNMEDVEEILDAAIPDEKVEFLPAGITYHLLTALQFFGSPRLTFGAVHPNCESATFLLSDGGRFHALSHYLKRPLDEIGAELVRRAKDLEPRLRRLDPARRLQRWRGRWLVLKSLAGWARRSLDLRRTLKGNPAITTLRILAGLMLGRRFKDLLRKHSRVQSALTIIILPFEEHHSIDGARLEMCKAGFAFEDPETGEVRTVPVCAWSLYKNEVQRKLAEKYAPATV